MEISNYLQIKKKLPLNVNLLAVSKGFSSKEIKIINNLGQNDFGESKFQEAIEKKLLLDDLKNIKWHFIGRVQTNKIRKIVQNFEYIHSVDSYEKLLKISNVSFEEKRNPIVMLQVKLSDDPSKGGFNPKLLIEKYKTIKVPSMVIGKPNENRFSCGADLVIIPIATFINNTTNTTGNIIIDAFTNMEPEAAMPPSINAEGTGSVPIGIN